MSQQCRIIESLLSSYEWFFNCNEDDDLDEDVDFSSSPADAPGGLDHSAALIASGNKNMDLVKLTDSGQETNHSVLLSNLQKLEDAGKITAKNSTTDVR